MRFAVCGSGGVWELSYEEIALCVWEFQNVGAAVGRSCSPWELWCLEIAVWVAESRSCEV